MSVNSTLSNIYKITFYIHLTLLNNSFNYLYSLLPSKVAVELAKPTLYIKVP